MKCAACKTENPGRGEFCVRCGAPLAPAPRAPRTPAMALMHGAMWTVFVLISIVVFGLIFYRAYFWIDAWRMEHFYERDGSTAPDVEQVQLDGNLAGHAITFYGKDGDAVFIKELRQSYEIIGHLARIEIPDSHWFGPHPEETEAAVVTLTPILYTEGGGQQPLPPLTLTVDTPESPLELINPPKAFEQVNTSMYPLKIKVAPRSTVLVGGVDQTDAATHEGILECYVKTYPVGDNVISLLVSTPSHKQTRMDINLYRAPQEINLEPSLNQEKKSSRPNIKVSGKMTRGAYLTVDTPYVEDSIVVKDNVDQEGNVEFEFVAKLDLVGDNTVTFRASQEGKQDSSVSLNIYYVPTLDAYSRSAWKMDYKALSLYYEIWIGRRFLCDGVVTEVSVEGDEQTVVMDVNREGVGEPQYVILLNRSPVGTPEVGQRYHAYADVTGNQFYNNQYCPKLTCRYMIAR
ncbi:MAG: hypothetical protein VB067_07595 [Christensenellaceae bacterium]|nr:hypothetical protein [Christensenellaceae bacterium]